jgi:hypothetical protein
MTTRYLICGGRDFADAMMMNKALRALILHPEEAVILNGGARGADGMAAEWGRERGCKIETLSAQWKRFGLSAGPIRNRAMLDAKPDVVIAFPGKTGTQNMVDQARARGVVVVQVVA